MADVLIIGGGVIGMSCAYELSQRGVQVTVIDRGEIGHGCSYGNAGWITPCFAMPLPQPGMLLKSIRWLLDPGSPLHIKPQLNLLLFRWLARFLLSMNERLMLRSVAALTEISKYSLDAYAELDRRFPERLGFERKGLLMVAQGPRTLESARREMELMARHGIPGRLLDEGATRELEPALTGALTGSVYFPSEAHAEPLAITRVLREAVLARGGRVLPFTEVFDFEVSQGQVSGVRTTHGWLRASDYVLATGSWSTPIARSLGLRVPVMGGKGYAIIVKPFSPAPRIPLMLIERKIAVTPRKDTVRLAGTLELVDRDESITRRRVDAILEGSRLFMNVPEQVETLEIWRGLRPCTPDGVPVIGRSQAIRNLVVATGHQMLGVQSAPGTGRLVADLVCGAPPAFDPAPFRVERF